MPASAIEVRDFVKRYGDFVAVSGISFSVSRGEVFGLLGPNGAGKTTILECLEGLRFADRGTLRVAGLDPASDLASLRRRIGVQLQSSGLPDTMTVSEAVRIFCAYRGIAPRIDLLARLRLGDQQRTGYAALSKGQQRLLNLVLALIHEPEIVILDEPTAGLDVASRSELHRLIRELRSAGTTVLMATHDMAEAEELCDHVAILLRGQLAAVGTPLQITAQGAGLTKITVQTERSLLLTAVQEWPGVVRTAPRDGYAVYYSDSVARTLAALLAEIDRLNDSLVDLRVERPSLEDRFLEITTPGRLP
ncbi:MAG: ABC transporter ATP-binding protein [Acidobacteriota bacterium]